MAYFEAIISKDIEWYDNLRHPSEVPSQMETQLLKYTKALASENAKFWFYVGYFTTAVTLGTAYAWILALMFLSVAPCVLGTTYFFASFMSNSAKTMASAYGQAGGVVEEVLHNLRTVVAFGGEEREVDRYGEQLDGARIQMWKQIIVQQCFFVCSNVFGNVFFLVLWYGGTVLLAENKPSPLTGDPYSPRDLFTPLIAVYAAYSSVLDGADALTVVFEGQIAATAIFSVIDSKPVIEPAQQTALQLPLPGELAQVKEIRFQNVHFAYPRRPEVPILKGVTLTIKSGEKVAFVGESGSGKSTIIQLLERFYDPVISTCDNYKEDYDITSAGKITANGFDLAHDLPVLAWRAIIGYVGQEPTLLATTVMENIRLGDPSASDADVIKAAKMARAHEFVDTFTDKYDTLVGAGGILLSGGQKQRIAIARALIKCPKILLLDEATSALDNDSEKMVQETIDDLQLSEGDNKDLIVIVVAHRLSTIRSSDKIFFLANGKIAEQGRHEELMELRGSYYSLVETQEAVNQLDCTSSDDEKPINSGNFFSERRLSSASSDVSNGTNNTIDVLQGYGDDGYVLRAEDVTREFVIARLKEQGRQINDDSIEKERRAIILKECNYKFDLKRLFSFTPDENPWMVVMILACIATGAYAPIQGYLGGQALKNVASCEEFRDDDGYVPEDHPCIDNITDGLDTSLIRAAINAICGVISFFTMAASLGYVTGWAVLRIRVATFAALVRQEISYHDHPDHHSGIVSSWLATSCLALSELMGPVFATCFAAVCSLTMSVGIAFYFSWEVALTLGMVLPILVGGYVLLNEFFLDKTPSAALYSQAGLIATEAILNVRTFRAMNAQQSMLKEYREKIDGPYQTVLSQLPKTAFVGGYLPFVICFINVPAFGFGAWYVREGYITGYDLYLSQMSCILSLVFALKRLALIPDFMAGRVAAYDLFSIMDRKSKIDAAPQHALQPGLNVNTTGDGVLEFKNVDFRYETRPDLQVLRGVSFSVKFGSTIGLVGPSGSGKSTIIQLMMRFYDPLEGSICIGGTELKDLDLQWWRRNLGFVGQEPVLFDMTVEDNIRYGKPEATHQEVMDAARRANIDYVGADQAIDWDDSVGLRGGQLSGGQKQRIAIARALIRDPPFLLLDEATSALDSQSEALVQHAIDAATKGRTTFIVAHRLSTIANADNIMVIAQGRLVEEGTHQELVMLDGFYAKLLSRGKH